MKKRARCPEGGIALVEHLRKQWLTAGGGSRVDGPKAPTRFVCSSSIADSIGKELLDMELYPDGRTVKRASPAPRRTDRGRPYLRDGDHINGMRVETFPDEPGQSYSVAGLAWVS